MKEFEKWWKKECETNIGNRFNTPKSFAEQAWKTALEWALSHKDSYVDQYIEDVDNRIMAVSSNVIEEELGE